MKKCAVVYVRQYTGKEYWADSVDERGCTYRLCPRTTDIPRNHYEAAEFYGKKRRQRAEKRIANDKKHQAWPGYSAYIIEYDREPEWRFELMYILEAQYGNRFHDEVPKRFPLRDDVKYRIWNGRTRPLICDLEEDELQRLYEWRKDHYKGKIRDEI